MERPAHDARRKNAFVTREEPMQLLELLRSAECRRAQPRGLRVARHPIRRIEPWLAERRRMTFLREVDTFFGTRMLVPIPDPVAVSLYRYGAYDASTTAFLLHLLKPGDHVIDVGAHVGYFTLLASRLTGNHGKVAAFEPNEFTRALLRRNARDLVNVAVVGEAVGASVGSAELRVPAPADSAFATVAAGDRTGSTVAEWVAQPVARTSLDAYAAETGLSPILIKLDVENEEESALEGMHQVLAQNRPAIILELGDIGVPPGRSRRLLERVLAEDYEAIEVAEDLTLRKHGLQEQYGYCNVLLVPTERRS
jgi:FkbM family methyltransferase